MSGAVGREKKKKKIRLRVSFFYFKLFLSSKQNTKLENLIVLISPK